MAAVAAAEPTIPTAAVVLAAGEGTRMKSKLPKVMHAVAGRPLVQHALTTLSAEGLSPLVVVVGPGMEQVAAAVAPHKTVVQNDRKGTGHAVLQAKDVLNGFEGDVLIAFGDTPFVTAATVAKMRAARQLPNAPKVIVLGFTPPHPGDYGRLIVGADGLERIVEAKDATPEERAVRLCNSGIMLVDGKILWPLLADVGAHNAKGEYYLTDVVGLARKAGYTCGVVEGETDELMGINSRADLAKAEAVAQEQLRRAAMDNGVTLQAPETVFFSADTKLGRDVQIGPFVVFGPGVTVDEGALNT